MSDDITELGPLVNTADPPRVLFAKTLTNSDCCQTISKGGRITLPRLAVETNLPVLNNRKHNEVELVDAADGERRRFLIKSWPSGGSDKRVYVMERVAGWLKQRQLVVGNVIAVTRRPDGHLGIEANTQAARQAAVMQAGAARAANADSSAAAAGKGRERRAAEPAGQPHAGVSMPLETAGASQDWHGPSAQALLQEGFPAQGLSLHRLQGLLVAKQLTHSDLQLGRVLLPCMAVEANLPQAQDTMLLPVALQDDYGRQWSAAIARHDGVGQRMFILEGMGMYLQQKGLRPGDSLGISRRQDGALSLVLNPVRAAPAANGDLEVLSPLSPGREEGDAEGDPARRQSGRRRRFRAGCEVNLARLLGSACKANGLLDPFQNLPDGSFPEAPLPPPPDLKLPQAAQQAVMLAAAQQHHLPLLQALQRQVQAGILPQGAGAAAAQHLLALQPPHTQPGGQSLTPRSAMHPPQALFVPPGGQQERTTPNGQAQAGGSMTPAVAASTPPLSEAQPQQQPPSSMGSGLLLNPLLATHSGALLLQRAVQAGAAGLQQSSESGGPAMFRGPFVAAPGSGGPPAGVQQGMAPSSQGLAGFPSNYGGAALQQAASPGAEGQLGVSNSGGMASPFAAPSFQVLSAQGAQPEHPPEPARQPSRQRGSRAGSGSTGRAGLARRNSIAAAARGMSLHEHAAGNASAPRIVGPPAVPHGSLGRGEGAPADLARSRVLVTKVLTNSDTHGRVILPRVAVEANMSFLVGYRSYKLQLKDARARKWGMVIKSWANGTEHRRVYVLEQAAEYLRTNKLTVGDALGICTDGEGELIIEHNSDDVKQATLKPVYMKNGGGIDRMPPPSPNTASPILGPSPGKCMRNPYCLKPGGHPGFCSGPRAAAERAQREAAEQPRDHPVPVPSPLDDISEAVALQPADMGTGTLVTKTLIHPDIVKGQVLLPNPAVQASIPQAAEHPLSTFTVQALDGHVYDLLLRNWVSCANVQMFMLERAGALLRDAGAQPGDTMELRREDGRALAFTCTRSQQQHGAAADVRPATCSATAGCIKPLGHQGLCSRRRGARKRAVEASADDQGLDDSDVDVSESESGAHGGRSRGAAARAAPQANGRAGAHKRRASTALDDGLGLEPAESGRMVNVTCQGMTGMYDTSRGSVAIRFGFNGQIQTKYMTPAEFEQSAGTKQHLDWRKTLLVEVSGLDAMGARGAITLGAWLDQQGIEVDALGKQIGSARQPRGAAARSGRAASLPMRRTGGGDPLPDPLSGAGTGKRSRMAKASSSRRANSLVTTDDEDSLAAGVLMSLNWGNNSSHVTRGGESEFAHEVDSPTPAQAAEPLASSKRPKLACKQVLQMRAPPPPASGAAQAARSEGAASESVALSETSGPSHLHPVPARRTEADRTASLEVPLVATHRVPGVAAIDPAGSAVLDQVLMQAAGMTRSNSDAVMQPATATS